MLAPSFVVRRRYESSFLQATALDRGVRLDHGIRGGCVVAVGQSDRSPLSSTDRGPSELKIAQLPAFTVLRTIDRPDVALLARGDAPEAPGIVALQPAAYVEISALPATGLTEIVQQRLELADVRQVAAEQVSVHSDLGATDREGPANNSLASMDHAARLANPEINLASTGTFETESLAPSALTSRHFTVVKEAARSRLPLTVSVRPSAALPVLSDLKTDARPPLLESLPAQAIAGVPVPPLERAVLTDRAAEHQDPSADCACRCPCA